MKYTPKGVDESLQDTADRLANYRTHQDLHGFSKWIVIERDSGNPVGDAGLLVLDDLDWIDLGFRFARPFWGRGLATQAASAWISTAFAKLGIESLGAFTHPDNAASIRVLEKLGFSSMRTGAVLGMPSILFSLSRPNRGEFALSRTRGVGDLLHTKTCK
jgi:RimJ/RimL family protein N-acetyltransferase